jgi:hypothetical protein
MGERIVIGKVGKADFRGPEVALLIIPRTACHRNVHSQSAGFPLSYPLPVPSYIQSVMEDGEHFFLMK